ncbi:2-methylbutyraldehyde reductase [Wallemia mellicola CBS 633.66]|uniref:2-methylbutyraldehyde reductase n=3 Tax=Wallemia mellicola TaxID=1708541 RepID=A0A4T0Q6C8_9BASI|nr:2-methylbutyraldehyde reductase [Wallemia mellicola CBS 633.66]TIB76516.1 hypothetical protein E3Q23_01789 [Wallemia mellicola]EIM21377.1 2-methylbutyraldehyde reductase [Wallemia mellicola CBS 633.66]TIB94018.1 2-methylbutyraldehyde reductase [Wallemia mellicola]TIC17115.1 2-methylbutyraldehyde reductase [Wallemia mellicola]TIC19642.1 2-methylbutyraldehyde reductase [Wallemia mellicola]|eukprot:XP_006958723.1 2-methylbutyraldehyde reductase [Wallemia mellicola CBS 633.66]
MPATSFQLNNGKTIPSVGLGTWQSAPGEVANAVKYAIKDAGYRHIDGAFCYANEKEVGEGVKASGVPRSEVFLTSKLWCTYHTKVEAGLDETLAELGTDYLDLFLIHWPVAMNPNGTDKRFPVRSDGSRDVIFDRPIEDTWRDMEKLVDSGKAKSIGVSNFNKENLARILKICRIKPVVNQVESHAYLSQRDIKKFAEENGVLLQAYSPLGSTDSPILKDEELLAIANKHNVSVGTVLISYQNNRGVIVLPKSVTPARIAANAQLIDLTPEEINTIETMEDRGKKLRVVSPDWGVPIF